MSKLSRNSKLAQWRSDYVGLCFIQGVEWQGPDPVKTAKKHVPMAGSQSVNDDIQKAERFDKDAVW
ncbi:hypothetical protein MCOR27_010913 [Pyricularia oryzae]|uniref:Uncharacterized protein n=5 Tax=Pyricularia TaxID=48558 RepID=A0ABQ8N2R9_PYRGI|nr:uncharacterized protein MGG_17190 [Pyricularia oryzae 70-15]ELQ44183.1 hypothetical protein OOU_Y34scaffold00095g28 [Pyricularia oryzae Y34]KAH8843347.1 hypothetical protein MCOR01_004163 [Pyricularia oryzae]KAI6290280.1 hypothetical protein MCOR33_011394 [Pyricularia grisea]EHA50909.1 hypothetical protein MGG_17190 [Pyricularia oryzae 70-15]KAI6257343.1 hypothetical protein MCOR19_006202 [Pyricularia oryzae]